MSWKLLIVFLLPFQAVAFSGASQIELSFMHGFLGDTTNSEVFTFLERHLYENPGSQKSANDMASLQSKIEKHNKSEKAKSEGMQKPPLAGVGERELSNALAAAAQYNHAIGASLFNKYGAKIAFWGVQTQSAKLKSGLMRSLKQKPKSEKVFASRCSEADVKSNNYKEYKGSVCYTIRGKVSYRHKNKKVHVGYAEIVVAEEYLQRNTAKR